MRTGIKIAHSGPACSPKMRARNSADATLSRARMMRWLSWIPTAVPPSISFRCARLPKHCAVRTDFAEAQTGKRGAITFHRGPDPRQREFFTARLEQVQDAREDFAVVEPSCGRIDGF